MDGLWLSLLEGRFAVCFLSSDVPLPAWFRDAEPVSATFRTRDELTLVCPEDDVPADATAERGWRALKLEGQFPFTLTGVLAAVLDPLAEAGVPIFALSAYTTDYVLVPGERADDAVAALRAAGHDVAS